jgi:hypothetical protein
MKQLHLFDDYGPVLTIEENNNMTWLDLYNFLHKNANDAKKFNDMSRFWNQHVMVHNMETDDEYPCDTLIINDRLVLSINDEE